MNVVVCFNDPLVAVAVMVWFWTMGVPGVCGGFMLPPPPPPPQAANPIRSMMATTLPPTRFRRRRRARIPSASKPTQKMSARRALPVVSQFLKSMCRTLGAAAVAAVVVTVIVVVPFPEIVVGLKVQAAPGDGSPEHENVVAALNPFAA